VASAYDIDGTGICGILGDKRDEIITLRVRIHTHFRITLRQAQCDRNLFHQRSTALHHSTTKARLKYQSENGLFSFSEVFFVSFLDKQKRKEPLAVDSRLLRRGTPH
jgi:hypothetical protein